MHFLDIKSCISKGNSRFSSCSATEIIAFIVWELKQFPVKAAVSQWEMPAFMVKDAMHLAPNPVRILYKRQDSEEGKLLQIMRSCVNFTPVGSLYWLHTSQLELPVKAHISTKLFLFNQTCSRIMNFFLLPLLFYYLWKDNGCFLWLIGIER